jgi:hypothetical protein
MTQEEAQAEMYSLMDRDRQIKKSLHELNERREALYDRVRALLRAYPTLQFRP